jgi:peptide/nickel transport system permease protein
VLRHLGRCAVQLVVAMVGIVTVAFFLMRAIPGDPALYMLGDFATREALAALRARLGLDQSLLDQYLLFLRGALRGDLGMSVVTGQPAPASRWRCWRACRSASSPRCGRAASSTCW